jgi:hypothetical protein
VVDQIILEIVRNQNKLDINGINAGTGAVSAIVAINLIENWTPGAVRFDLDEEVPVVGESDQIDTTNPKVDFTLHAEPTGFKL